MGESGNKGWRVHVGECQREGRERGKKRGRVERAQALSISEGSCAKAASEVIQRRGAVRALRDIQVGAEQLVERVSDDGSMAVTGVWRYLVRMEKQWLCVWGRATMIASNESRGVQRRRQGTTDVVWGLYEWRAM